MTAQRPSDTPSTPHEIRPEDLPVDVADRALTGLLQAVALAESLEEGFIETDETTARCFGGLAALMAASSAELGAVVEQLQALVTAADATP
jgi:hypothetical protein